MEKECREYIALKNKEILDFYYDKKYTDIQNEMTKEKDILTPKGVLIGLDDYINEGIRNTRKFGMRISRILSRVKIRNKLYYLKCQLLMQDILDCDTEYFYNKVDEIIEYTIVINNLLAAIKYVIVTNKYDLDEELTKNIFATCCLICEIYGNLQIYIEEQMNIIINLNKGINYSGRYNIDPAFQIDYIISKFEELEILDQIKEYITKSFGEDYFILNIIENEQNNVKNLENKPKNN